MTAELVIEATGEVVQQMTASEASNLTDEIRYDLADMAEAYERVMPKIREALTRLAWDALGYRSAGEYVSEEFGGALGRLDQEARRGVVRELAAAGMSTRTIAPVVGVNNATVHRDLHRDLSGVADATPESNAGWKPPSELLAEPSQSGPPAKVIGIDGKQYSRPEPRQEPVQEATHRQIEQGWRDTCTRIAECVRFLDGGAAYGRSFLNEFYPHEADYLAPGMRLTRERIDSCIEFLQTIRNGIDR